MNIFDNKVFKRESEHLYFDGTDVTKLAEEYGTPLYVFSEREIRKNVNEVLVAFRTHYSKTSIHYAAKCESTLANLQIIRDTGIDLEVNSGGELFKGIYAGFEGKQIVFNGGGKSVDELTLAIEHRIKAINVDSVYELTRIIQISKAQGIPANITLRIVPGVSAGVAKGNETGTHESKFGITFDQLRTAIEIALKYKEQINLMGYHFHIGTQTFEINPFIEAFTVMLQMAIKMNKLTGYVPQYLNIGGGLPVSHYLDAAASKYMEKNIYKMLNSTLTMEEIAAAVARELSEESIEKWAGVEYKDFFKDVELLIEPGRKITSSAGILLSQIENEKYRKDTNENWIMLNAGFNTLLEVRTYFWYYHMICANKAMEPHVSPYKVAGPCCDSGDVYYDIDNHKNLPDYRMLPKSIVPGDVIAMINVGAYGTPNMSNYNGRPKAGVALVKKNGSVKMIKKPQEHEDLLEGEVNFNDTLQLCI